MGQPLAATTTENTMSGRWQPVLRSPGLLVGTLPISRNWMLSMRSWGCLRFLDKVKIWSKVFRS